MRRVALIALLTIAVVCAPKFLRRAATPPVKNPPHRIVTDNFSPSTEAGNEGEQIPAGISALQTPDRTPASTFRPGSKISIEEYRLRQIAALSERPAVEAVVIEETENGQTVYQSPTTTDSAVRLDNIVQNHPDTASSDLLTMFQMEFNSQDKSAILSAASLFPGDYNLWSLLEAGLSMSQPPEIRAEAAAFALSRNPDLLLNHLTDPDPLVQLEIQSALITSEPTTTIFKGSPPLDPDKSKSSHVNTN